MLILKLTEKQLTQLHELLDASLKAEGLKVLGHVVDLYNLLQTAVVVQDMVNENENDVEEPSDSG